MNLRNRCRLRTILSTLVIGCSLTLPGLACSSGERKGSNVPQSPSSTGGANAAGGSGGASAPSGGSSGAGGSSANRDASVSSGSGGTASRDAAAGPGGSPAAQDAATAALDPRDAANVFMSGHSIFNLVMPAMLDQIARGLGRAHLFNLQMGLGSSMRFRLSGMGNEQDRTGAPLPFVVQDEIANATTIGQGNKYDTLIVTEALPIQEHLVYSDSVGQLRIFYDLLMQSDPNGLVYFFDGWDEVAGGDTAAWVSATRDKFVVWECIASAVNRDPTVERNPIQIMSAALALVRAVEEADKGTIPGVSSGIELFAPDQHHASNLGNYYVALVTYATLYRRSPAGAPVDFMTPQGNVSGFVSAEGAARLQELAWESVSALLADPPDVHRSMSECRTAVAPYCEAPDCATRLLMIFAD